MKNKSIPLIFAVLLLQQSPVARASAANYRDFAGFGEEPDLQYRPEKLNQIQVSWGAMTRPWTRNALLKELARPLNGDKAGLTVNSLPFSRLDGTSNDERNPFWIHPGDFFTGMNRVLPPQIPGPIPTVPASDRSWFGDQLSKGLAPDVFVIGGHHVISEGFHNDPESMFMYTPTLEGTIAHTPEAREYFDHVRFAVLFGCNTLTDLEPHAENGDYLPPKEIEKLYFSGTEERAKLVGSTWATNTLEFYRARLAREYGPGMGKHYEYTRDASKEVCVPSPSFPYLNCKITNLERILPDYLLYNGEHRLNGAYVHKRIFRNAYLVLGFNSASPAEEVRVKIFQATISAAYKDFNSHLENGEKPTSNLIREIIGEETPKDRRVRLIQAVRKAWTEMTYKMNRERPSGSITPALPELDRDGMFPVYINKDTPLHAPYEPREAKEEPPKEMKELQKEKAAPNFELSEQ